MKDLSLTEKVYCLIALFIYSSFIIFSINENYNKIISDNIFVKYFDDGDSGDDDSYLNHLFIAIPIKSSYIYHANE